MLCSLGHFIVCWSRALHIFGTQNAYIASASGREYRWNVMHSLTYKLNIHAMHCWYLFCNTNSNNILFAGNSKWATRWCAHQMEMQSPNRGKNQFAAVATTHHTKHDLHICANLEGGKRDRRREGENNKKHARARLFLFAVRSNYINNTESATRVVFVLKQKKQKHAEHNNIFDLISKFTVDASAVAASATLTAAFGAECLLQSTTARVKWHCSKLTAAKSSDLSPSSVYHSELSVSFVCSNGLQFNCKIAFSTQ